MATVRSLNRIRRLLPIASRFALFGLFGRAPVGSVSPSGRGSTRREGGHARPPPGGPPSPAGIASFFEWQSTRTSTGIAHPNSSLVKGGSISVLLGEATRLLQLRP